MNNLPINQFKISCDFLKKFQFYKDTVLAKSFDCTISEVVSLHIKTLSNPIIVIMQRLFHHPKFFRMLDVLGQVTLTLS